LLVVARLASRDYFRRARSPVSKPFTVFMRVIRLRPLFNSGHRDPSGTVPNLTSGSPRVPLNRLSPCGKFHPCYRLSPDGVRNRASRERLRNKRKKRARERERERDERATFGAVAHVESNYNVDVTRQSNRGDDGRATNPSGPLIVKVSTGRAGRAASASGWHTTSRE